jgi:hypothetical protein
MKTLFLPNERLYPTRRIIPLFYYLLFPGLPPEMRLPLVFFQEIKKVHGIL